MEPPIRITYDAFAYLTSRSIEDFDKICSKIQLFKLVDNIDNNSLVIIQKKKDKKERHPDYEYKIVYNKPRDLMFIAAACYDNPDLLWQSSYTQVIERSQNYVNRYCKPSITPPKFDGDRYVVDYKDIYIYYKLLQMLTNDTSYIVDLRLQIKKLKSEAAKLNEKITA